MMGSQPSSNFLGTEAFCFNFSSLIFMREMGREMMSGRLQGLLTQTELGQPTRLHAGGWQEKNNKIWPASGPNLSDLTESVRGVFFLVSTRYSPAFSREEGGDGGQHRQSKLDVGEA
jgi:hypothetical protein